MCIKIAGFIPSKCFLFLSQRLHMFIVRSFIKSHNMVNSIICMKIAFLLKCIQLKDVWNTRLVPYLPHVFDRWWVTDTLAWKWSSGGIAPFIMLCTSAVIFVSFHLGVVLKVLYHMQLISKLQLTVPSMFRSYTVQ